MSAHPQEIIKMPNTAAILQLNCRRAPSVMYSLFNDTNITNFLIIALQEPPVNPHTNSPFEHSGWHLMVTPPKDMSETCRPRSCIYVNTQANATVQPIHSSSRDVSACTVSIQDQELLHW